MKEKESGFQLLKIFSMLIIVLHHFVEKNAFNIDTDIIGITGNKLILQVIGNNAFIGNNLFFLISAWFLSSKDESQTNLTYSIKSIWRIEKIVLFYSLGLYMVTKIIGGGQNLFLLMNSILPTLMGLWWYPTTYSVFLLIWPFYHKGLCSFTKEELKKCIAVMLAVWSVSTLIPYTNLGASNFTAFLTLYAIVVYIRRQNITYDENKKKVRQLVMIPYAFSVLSIGALDLLGKKIPTAALYSCYYIRGNFRLVSMLVSIGIFLWSTSWNMKRNKVINYIADLTFGIYLIHMYPPVMEWLFKQVFNLSRYINTEWAVPYVLGGTTIVFIGAGIIEAIRMCLFNMMKSKISKLESISLV